MSHTHLLSHHIASGSGRLTARLPPSQTCTAAPPASAGRTSGRSEAVESEPARQHPGAQQQFERVGFALSGFQRALRTGVGLLHQYHDAGLRCRRRQDDVQRCGTGEHPRLFGQSSPRIMLRSTSTSRRSNPLCWRQAYRLLTPTRSRMRVAIGGTADVLNMGSGSRGTRTTTRSRVVQPTSLMSFRKGTYSTASRHGWQLLHPMRRATVLVCVIKVPRCIQRGQGIMYPVLVFQDAWWTTGTDDLGNYQDDMAMLANSLNGFGLRADDHAGTIAGATPLVGSGTNFSGSGVIGVGGDVDVWSLTTSGTNSVQGEGRRQCHRPEPGRGY